MTLIILPRIESLHQTRGDSRIQLALLAVQTAAVRVATAAWTAAQWLLNAAMTANPVGLVIAAIVALVAVFVIAYKKSETFRKIVHKAWNGIKAASVAVFGFLKGFITATWNAIRSAVSSAVNSVKSTVAKVWNSIKSATSATWNAIKSVLSSAWSAIRNVVSNGINAAKSVITKVWTFVKTTTVAAWNAIKNAVSDGINGMMNFINGIQGKVTGALAGAASWLYDAGVNIIQGLLSGIESMIGTVRNKLGQLTDMIPNWKGPREKDKRLLRPVGRLIMQGLVDGFEDGRAGIKKSLDGITNLIGNRMKKQGKSNEAIKKATKELGDLYKKREKRLIKHAKRLNAANKRIAKAQKALSDIRKEAADYARDIAGGALDFGSITGMGAAFNSDAMLAEFQNRIDKIRYFNTVLQDLVAQGLDSALVDQLAQAGVEGGLAYAVAIQTGGADAIAEFNNLQTQLESASTALGGTASGSMYDAGVAAAEGMVNGLNRMRRRLERTADRLARAMVKAIKKALGINSPSRVFADLGRQTLAGMEVGLRDTQGVKKATVNIGQAMKDSFKRPDLEANASIHGRGGDTVIIKVNVPATANPAQTGREVVKAIKAYYAQGGTQVAIT